MPLKTKITFQQILEAVKVLTPSQKKRLINVINTSLKTQKQKSDFTSFLLSGPVFSKRQIEVITQNRKSLNQWRTTTY
jgi:hypothetical protein